MARPSVFDPPSCFSRCDLPSSVAKRITGFAQNLSKPQSLPKPFKPPLHPGLTVFVPHYSEDIRVSKDTLFNRNADDQSVQCIQWLYDKYTSEFHNFKERTKVGVRDVGDVRVRVPDTAWDQYNDEEWELICDWASLRSQTLWKTVDGLNKYDEVLKFYSARSNVAPQLKDEESFTLLIAMQNYESFQRGSQNLADVEKMLRKYGKSLKIAFIKSQEVNSIKSSHSVVFIRGLYTTYLTLLSLYLC